jgi:hypothetical protein
MYVALMEIILRVNVTQKQFKYLKFSPLKVTAEMNFIKSTQAFWIVISAYLQHLTIVGVIMVVFLVLQTTVMGWTSQSESRQHNFAPDAKIKSYQGCQIFLVQNTKTGENIPN